MAKANKPGPKTKKVDAKVKKGAVKARGPKKTVAATRTKRGAATNAVTRTPRRAKTISHAERTFDMQRRDFFAANSMKGFIARGHSVGPVEAQQIVQAADHVIAALNAPIQTTLQRQVEAELNG